MLGLGIYMGEGTKTANVVRIVNANPNIIKISILWFREIIGLKDENITLRMYLYPDNDIEECKKFWLDITGLPETCLLKSQIDNRKNKKLNKNRKLEHGTVHLGVKGRGDKKFGVFLFRKIQGWQKALL